ncbi:MAG: thymidine phosphorylase [Bdellovibrionia bacterium]
MALSSLTPALIIKKKRDGKKLSREEIFDLIEGLSTQPEATVTDYQISAFLMAVYFSGMSLDETVALTEAMLKSGERYDLSQVPGFKVDKHSTGGIGDKVSLILAPLSAACGLKVPMMAGRGLGFSGGTLDKLESIEGFNVRLTRPQFEAMLERVGCAIIGQSEKIAPADKKLYAIRDVTATVECLPLITASILSKKLAEGTQALVLDVKVGSGAFMKTRKEARVLAKRLIQVAQKLKLPTRAVLTDMNQPLGYAVGNSLEVQESIEVLRNEKKDTTCSADLKELSIHLCAQMLVLSKQVKTLTEGRKLVHTKLSDGSAWKIFQQMVQSQGGNLKQILNPSLLPKAPHQVTWRAKRSGFISKIQTETIGLILIALGGGRKKATDRIDHSVGLVFHKKLGAKVQTGQPLVTVYAQKHTELEPLEKLFQQAIEITQERKPVPKLILEHV